MPSTQLNIRLGSDNELFRHDVPPNVRRSSFNLSRKRDFTLDPGAIVPIDLIETVPGDSFEISVDYLLKSMPMVVTPFTSYRVRTHWYYCRMVDLWKGGATFMTKGRSGSLSLKVPSATRMYFDGKISESVTGNNYFDCPQSLWCYLGLPPKRYTDFSAIVEDSVVDNGYIYPYAQCSEDSFEVSTSFNVSFEFSVLPFFMYQKIYRMAYTVPNLLQDNKIWFPDDVSDGWRIDYSASNLNKDSDNNNFNNFFVPSGTISIDNVSAFASPSVSDTCVFLGHLRYALFEDDVFTTALPWAQRGTAPVIDLKSSIPALSFDDAKIQVVRPSSDVNVRWENDINSSYVGDVDFDNFDIVLNVNSAGANRPINTSNIVSNQALRLSVHGSTKPSVSGGAQFNLNEFRELIALSVWQERNARTQGDYNSTIYAHFNVNPHLNDYEPRYIGGTSDVISFAEVVQTSESGTTPQGTGTGLAQSQASGKVGFFQAPDYGYIMGVMIIQPETVYSSEVEKLWTRKIMEDFFMPEDEGLGLQEVMVSQIFPTVSDKLFGYNERNLEYKTRKNQALGFFALSPSEDRMFSAYSQTRQFKEAPKLSHQFVVMSPENMRRDYLAVPSYPAFRCSLASQVKAVRPMAYKTVPQTFGF